MSCKYSLLFIFLCGFAVLSVSTMACEKETSCTIKLPAKNIPNEITWIHLSSGNLIHRKNGKIKSNTLKETMKEDGSLTFKSVSLKNTGKYKYSFYAGDGTETSGQVEMKAYAKLPKPTVMFDCQPNGSANLTCGIAYIEDLTISWYNGKQIINDASEKQLFLTSAQKQENKLYSCHAKNPISEEQSESITLSCSAGEGEGSGARKLFGLDFWIMVSILSGGGALLLLLICVLVICACLSCSQQKKHQQDEDELRLRVFQDEAPNSTTRSKRTARGQPAPPIPQEDTSPQTPTQTQTQPKAQTRARPPPPPEEDEEYPPPLPCPRNKQHRKRNEEPYLPME